MRLYSRRSLVILLILAMTVSSMSFPTFAVDEADQKQDFEALIADSELIAEGTEELVKYVASCLDKLPAIKRYEPEIVNVETVAEFKEKQSFTINVRDGVFYVDDADWVDDVMNKVDPDDYESLQYFERVLRSSGIIKALEKAGIHEGDTVSVCGVEFDYIP